MGRGQGNIIKRASVARSANPITHQLSTLVISANDVTAARDLLDTHLDDLGQRAFIWADDEELNLALLGDEAQINKACKQLAQLDIVKSVNTPERIGEVVEGSLGHRQVKGGSVELKQKIVWDGFGVDDYESNDGLPVEIEAYENGVVVADAQILVSGETRLRFIDTKEEFQRQGIASAILDAIKEQFGSWWTHDYTDEGQALIESYESSDQKEEVL